MTARIAVYWYLVQQDHILLSNMKHLTITFLDRSLGLLWFQSKKKSVFSKQKLTPFSRKKILDQHLITVSDYES